MASPLLTQTLTVVARGPDEPQWSMVSVSASKITNVGETPGMVYHASAPGYFMLLIRTDGSADVVAVAAPYEEAVCEQGSAERRAACVEAGIHAFQPRYSTSLTD